MSEIIQEFRELKPKLERLGQNVLTVLTQIISEKEIPIFTIESRIKDEESFLNKVMRKNCNNPFEEIDDLCGVRVICYYQEDIKSICKIIDDEFNVIQSEDKKTELKNDQFGYLSYHYVIELKDEWLLHPSARGLKSFKAEIQIRTMLMHTWSAISHKLLYKRESDVPPQFVRQLNRLSALIELADEQFDSIKNIKIKYIDNISISDPIFNLSELNSDSLIAVHKYFFNDRKYLDDDIPSLLNEIKEAGYDFKKFVSVVKNCLPILPEIEAEDSLVADIELPLWNFSGAIRSILDLSSDPYFEGRQAILPSDISSRRKKYRDQLKKTYDI